MEAVGLALSVVATVDLCIKYGNLLVDACITFKEADVQINQRILAVRNHWKRTSLQVQFLGRIWHKLDAEHQAIQNETLDELVHLLKTAISQFESLGKPPNVHAGSTKIGAPLKLKYTFIKNRLDKVIHDLSTWQQLYDPSWFLIMKIADPLVDQELSHQNFQSLSLQHQTSVNSISFRNATRPTSHQAPSIFLPEEGLLSAQTYHVSFSTAVCIQRPNSSKLLILDPIPCDTETDVRILTQDIRTLARKLSCPNLHPFGLLHCRGAIRQFSSPSSSCSTPTSSQVSLDPKRPTSFTLVFNLPVSLSPPQPPLSLRQLLLSRTPHTLTSRFHLAKHLARSLSFVHTLGFVHKNLRPENILVLPSPSEPLKSIQPFLTGFSNFRSETGRTLLRGDGVWGRDLYRHPERRGVKPQEVFVMQHDIFGLGVCLLEIGIWESFVEYDLVGDGEGNGGCGNGRVGEMLKGYILAAEERKQGKEEVREEEENEGLVGKEGLVELAVRALPEKMGEAYTEIVVNCLTCLDEGNVDFGNAEEFMDEDNVLIGVRYIEKVLKGLEKIAV